MILRFSRFSLSVRTVLFIKTIFPNFYPGQILLASEDLSASAKFDSRSGEKHDRVSAYISFVL